MASPELEQLIQNMQAFGTFAADVATMRKMMARTPAYPKPDDISWEPADADGVPAEWITPDAHDPDRVIVYFHGGGYATGSPEAFRSLTTHLARAARTRVLSVDYRLAPECPFPAAIDDAIAAYGFVRARGFTPDRVVLAGDSSGGGLVLGTLVSLRERREPLPATAVCLCPWTDLTLSGDSVTANAEVDPVVSAGTLANMAEAYLGDRDRRTPAASPLFADLTGLPPLLIQVGSTEVLLDDSRRLAAAAEAVGVDVTLDTWDDAVHVWHAFADVLPEARDAIAAIAAHIDQLGGPS